MGFTTPSSTITSFQSASDSLFAAYAWSHLNAYLSMSELKSSLKGQWPNGLIPKITMNPNTLASTWLPGTFYPGPNYWRTWQQSSHMTAGLAALPIHAFVAMQVFYHQRDAESLNFLAEVSGVMLLLVPSSPTITTICWLIWLNPELLSSQRVLVMDGLNMAGFPRHLWLPQVPSHDERCGQSSGALVSSMGK